MLPACHLTPDTHVLACPPLTYFEQASKTYQDNVGNYARTDIWGKRHARLDNLAEST